MPKLYAEADKLLKRLKTLDTKMLPQLAEYTKDSKTIYTSDDLQALKTVAEDMKATMTGFKNKLLAMGGLVTKISKADSASK